MSERIETRLYVEEDLVAGQVIGLDSPRAHYLRTVLRLQSGARLALFNGRDGAWTARIDALGKGWASLAVETRLTEQRGEPDIWLCFAPIKRTRLDFLVEKATELGVARLQPVMTRHTVVERVNLARLAATVREAAEQCERLTLPQVMAPVRLTALLQDWPQDRQLLLCAEAGAASPLAEVLTATPPGGAQALLTGPEGGFASRELDALVALPFVRAVGLGPRILRADTAALAALSCWQALRGDAKHRPEERRALAGRLSLGPLADSDGPEDDGPGSDGR
ncbi:MAG: 16S rRNA (uracil(1498)-N(3))-methyltransferase [Rhodospirillales bacterium]